MHVLLDQRLVEIIGGLDIVLDLGRQFARWQSNGPPGAARIMKKATVTMMKRVGIAPRKRLRA